MKHFIAAATLLLLLSACQHDHGPSTDYAVYGGNKESNRYSPLRQIDASNVGDLRPAWIYNSSDTGSRRHSDHEIQCQPIVVDGILYGVSPSLKLFALIAATGEAKWTSDPFQFAQARFNQCRGVTYWTDGKVRRIFYAAGTNLYCVDADSGIPDPRWGRDGRVSLYAGLDLNHPVEGLYVTATSPAIVYKNIVIIGSAVSESGDAAPGYVRAFDVQTGAMKWIFHTIPQPGDPGYETWSKDAYKWAGGTNNWSGMSLDEKRGVVYFGTGAPSSDFYGGDRAGANLFSDCVMALDAATGKVKWYYQTIHHDLWDRDIPCPPNLTTVMYDGKPRDVVVQATKDGLIYVLDRDSGTSLFPVEERPVPVKGLPGEKPFPSQRFPPNPFLLPHRSTPVSNLPNIPREANVNVRKLLDGRRKKSRTSS